MHLLSEPSSSAAGVNADSAAAIQQERLRVGSCRLLHLLRGLRPLRRTRPSCWPPLHIECQRRAMPTPPPESDSAAPPVPSLRQEGVPCLVEPVETRRRAKSNTRRMPHSRRMWLVQAITRPAAEASESDVEIARMQPRYSRRLLTCQNHADCSGESIANKPRLLFLLLHLGWDYIVSKFGQASISAITRLRSDSHFRDRFWWSIGPSLPG